MKFAVTSAGQKLTRFMFPAESVRGLRFASRREPEWLLQTICRDWSCYGVIAWPHTSRAQRNGAVSRGKGRTVLDSSGAEFTDGPIQASDFFGDYRSVYGASRAAACPFRRKRRR